MITVKEITSRSNKKKIFEFPVRLYKNNSCFVPTLISEEMRDFDPTKNAAFDYASCKMFLAYKDGEVAGRVAAILNNAYNYKMNVRQMRFTRFDFIDDYGVSEALFNKVAEWARFLDMNEIVGPLGFSDMDKMGMLIEGFDQMDMYITQYNYPYYISHMERLGLTKKVDWVEYKVHVPREMDPTLERLALGAMQKYGYSIRKFRKVKDLKPVFREALPVLNEAFSELFGVVRISENQLMDFAKLLMSICKLEYITVVGNKAGEIVGYGLMVPSISRGVRLGKGKLFPMGLYGIMRDIRRSKVLDMYHIGVMPAYQNRGVNAVIIYNSILNAMHTGVEYAETGPELEDNIKVRSQWKLFVHRTHRRRRCYGLTL
ncbi:MAG: hypothetical protein WC395_08705 [Bacteroidales bacterium]|jgi:hypothetical protein